MGTRSRRADDSGSPALAQLGDGNEAAVQPLVSKLMSDRHLQSLPLGRLFPELANAETSVLEAGLSARPANAVWRAGLRSFAELARRSPASLLDIPNLGPGGLKEILAFVVREWARARMDTSEQPIAGARVAAEVGALVGDGDLSAAFAGVERIPDFDLLRRHRLIEDRRSLRRLGGELGISGERVRQREKRVREAIQTQLRVRGSPLQRTATYLVGRLGALARPEELEAALAELDPGERALGGGPDRAALLLWLSAYEVRGGWVRRADLDRQTEEALGELTEDGPVALDVCFRRFSRFGIADELALPWIEGRQGFRIVGDRLAREAQVMDVPVEILRAAREPLDLHELFSRTGPPMCLESFRHRVQGDGRFRQRGAGRFGLSEWGEETYTTLIEKMAEEIDRCGGSVGLAELIVAMDSRFDASESSVLYRARMPQFEVDSAGRISRRLAPLVLPPRPLALTHNCYRLEAGWATKLNVTPSLLRGTTTRIPLAFARTLGLQFGTARELASPAGSIRIHWPRHAASAAQMSSLRAVATGLEAGVGDRLLLVHVGRDQLDFKLIRKERIEQATGIARLALECGSEPREDDPEGPILSALGFDPNLSDAEGAIRKRLVERREGRLAALLRN